ncbi:MAG: hypothetical protein MI748_17770, partial [Opitutales bacterium]|nr:hypothetical protein [Opitutales bacterium]
TIERREADEFDEVLVAAHTAKQQQEKKKFTGLTQLQVSTLTAQQGGCPGSRMRQFERPTQPATESTSTETTPSELTHWPVQINLLPPNAPILRHARLLVAADCVPIAYADFHSKLLKNRKVMIGCPKFDDLAGYVERLASIIQYNDLEEIVVARMEVPCCTGITMAVCEARRRANVPLVVIEVVVSTDGQLLSEREIPADSTA